MYNDYADDIFRFLYVHVHDRALAEDLTADTFTKAWQKLADFDFKHPRGWLYTIARNRLADHWRTHHTVALDEDFEVEDEREATEIKLDRQIDKAQLLKHLAGLPEDMRSVVTLRFLGGYSARKTGQALGISEANVRVIQHRALKKLKELYS
jgi:RNA polymerase sigma-70 factor (ECF subfamily)